LARAIAAVRTSDTSLPSSSAVPPVTEPSTPPAFLDVVAHGAAVKHRPRRQEISATNHLGSIEAIDAAMHTGNRVDDRDDQRIRAGN
jgi:hypothetical protein